MTRRHSAKSTSSQAAKGTMDALFTSTSSLPKRETVSPTIRSTSPFCEMSTSMPAPPFGAACSAPAPLTSATTTVAPSAPSLSAIALPMPCAAPVTIATLPSSLPIASS
jgi:hypothetical protein